MKKVICLALLALLFGACEEENSTQTQQVTVQQDTVQPTPKPTRIVGKTYSFGNTMVDVRLITIDGHEYIVAATKSLGANRPGGVSIIHSESCKCHKTQ